MRNINGKKMGVNKVIFAWFANNRGRGSDNVSLAVVTEGTPRASHAAKQTGVIASTRTSGWRGDVNFSQNVRRELGII